MPDSFTIRDFDWTAKLISATDSSTDTLVPLVQLKFHCEERKDPLIFEFTPNEVRLVTYSHNYQTLLQIDPAHNNSPYFIVIWIGMYAYLPPGYITKSTIKIALSGGLIFLGFEFFSGNERFHRDYVMPLVHRSMDAERAHELAVRVARFGVMSRFWEGIPKVSDKPGGYPELQLNFLGWQLDNPIGLAAGFDKNGEAIHGLQKMGFGFIEIGSVTPRPQPGNEKPRVFRLVEDKAVINSYGFNSDGIGVVSQRVKKAFDPNQRVILGVNLGKNKSTPDSLAANDYEIGVGYIASCCHYVVINVSSPNTPGLRALQSAKELKKILKTTRENLERMRTSPDRPKLFLKISPDLSAEERASIAKLCLDRSNGVDALIVANTTTTRPSTLISENATKPGGLSGRPLKELSKRCVTDIYKLTQGQVPIIGCGGVSSGEDAYEMIRAGASLVQLYTAIVYQGFPVVERVKRELAECLRRDGFASVSQAVGADLRK